MTLVRLDAVLAEADREGGAVGAFNVVHLENAEALVSAAEATGLPVVLQISENCVRYHGALAPIALATKAIAERSSALCVLHLDHAEDEALGRRGGGAGVHLGDVRRVTARRRDQPARDHGPWSSAVTPRESVSRPSSARSAARTGSTPRSARTDPEAAAAFVAETGVDALAVAVGSSHAMTSRTAELDLDLVSRLHEAVSVPLVLHGSSGVPDDVIVAAVRAGMRKVNIATHLNAVFTAAVEGVPRFASRRGGHPPLPGRRS